MHVRISYNMRKHLRNVLTVVIGGSGSGKTITTVEPKFIPREAVNVNLGEEIPVRIRLIDCVGFMVPEATGIWSRKKNEW